MPRSFLLLLALLVSAISCARHESDDDGGSATSPYVVTITSSLPLPPRSQLCGYVDKTATQAPAANVQILARSPSGQPFVITTDQMGNFCFSPAGQTQNPNGEWEIRADGALGQSEVLSFESLPYTREIVLTRDTWMNGETAIIRMVAVDQNENPTTNVVPSATFSISRNGQIVEMLSTDSAGMAIYTSNLLPGVYEIWGSDDWTGDITPIREIVTLAPSEAALGLSVAGQLDEIGSFLPVAERRWWDGRDGEEQQLQLVYFISQSSHIGGFVDLLDPQGQVVSIQVAPGASSVLWTPDRIGDWYGATEINLPSPGLSTSLSRRILVLPL